MRPRDILDANLKALMATHADLDTLPKITAKCGVSNGTLDRMRRAESAARIDELSALADAFDLHPWQLLVPGLDVSNPQLLSAPSDGERDLYRRLRALAEEFANYRLSKS